MPCDRELAQRFARWTEQGRAEFVEHALVTRTMVPLFVVAPDDLATLMRAEERPGRDDLTLA